MSGRRKTNWFATFMLTVGVLFILFPMYMALVVALKSPQQLAQSLLAFPARMHWGNFAQAMSATHYWHVFGNSFFITSCAVIFTIFTNSVVAYAIARNLHRAFFKGIYYYIISAMFVPFPVIMLPVIRQMSHLGLANRVGLIILYVVYGLSFNIFLYISYLKSIPMELEEAALVDGAGRWMIFWRIVFPLLSPVNATVGIVTALWAWNDFLLPLVMISDPSQYTLPLVQFAFQGQYSTNYNLSFASYILALLPMVVVYIVLQKRIINGVTQGSIR